MPALLVGEALEKEYRSGPEVVRVLRGVDVAISRGEVVTLVGASGVGKSTLLHLLGGLDRPTSGAVFFEGTSLSALDIDAFRALKVGFVFQSFHLLPTLSALENVQIPMFEAPWSRSERGVRAAKLLEEVGLSHRRHHAPSKLSVGERQRVAIARALANEPTLLFADEPTGNLDSVSQSEILDLLSRLRRERSLTMVIVTHSPEVSASADREIKLRDGRIVTDR